MAPQPTARGPWLGPEIYVYMTSVVDVPSRPAWLRQLSELSLDARGPALDVTLHAFAAAYHGAMSNDGSIMLEARRMYGDALSRQSRAIMSHRSEKPSPAVLYTSVIFSLFETISCTNYAAYATHLAAARKMLALTRSELGQDEMFERVAMHVQYQTLLLMIVSPLEYLAVDTETNIWIDLNMGLYDESQEVADLLLLQLFKLGKLVTASNCEPDSITSQLHEVRETIDGSWTAYHEEAILHDQAFRYEAGDETLYRDPSTALVLAYFATARLMVSLADLADAYVQSSKMDGYCQEIIDCSSFLFRRKGSIGCISLPVFLPLALVAMYAPSSRYRKKAYTLLNDRVETTPFKGLKFLLVERLRSADGARRSLLPDYVYTTNAIS
ncbi:hypothetical protein PISL3812_08300 [Talaromyces islandicus]|uniref:Uncharacterized protein n=1 Tax=Talaromyces islandicus TaxID=28573 RepID=A0A0U1M7B5_TALIS|nr:hypothetical protein PISL3812_08300 [Talaromyces islandicus]